jgi:gliding motility-associated-like protein
MYRVAVFHRLMKTCALFFFSLLIVTAILPPPLAAQDIGIRNASLEGVPAQYRAPAQWLVVCSTPDVQPGITGVYKPASHGATYVGFRGGAHWLEAIAQKLTKNMLNGRTYRLTMDLSFARGYDSATCYGALAIYGGTTLADTLEVLWQSGAFVNTEWQNFTAEFTVHGDYSYIVLGGDLRIACDNAYGIALAVDNLADTLRELPVVTHKVVPACKGMANGSIAVSTTGTYPPFTYEWSGLNSRSNTLNGVGAGQYIVTVHAANGVDVRDTIIVPETEFEGNAEVLAIGCTGENRNKIILHTVGGLAPYEYFLNGTADAKLSPEFDNLYAGAYKIIIKDAKGCQDTLPELIIPEPPPFIFEGRALHSMSCAVTNDAQLILTASGGIPPYTYAVPGLVSQADSIIRNLGGGTYNYRIIDAQDCYIEGRIEVPVATHTCAIYVPNAFSPDGDGLNDVFRVKVYDKVSDYRMSVYNRWGQQVYVTTDVSGGWRGDRNGQPLPAGAYLWSVIYTDSKQQGVKQTGSVVMIR